METLGGPRNDGGGPRLFAIAAALALVLVGLATWFVARRPGKEPRPTNTAVRPSPAPRPRPSATPEAPVARAQPESEPAPRAKATSLKVDSDIPGASVFLDRRFLGTTPLTTSDVEPGPHRLNVSTEGYEGYAEPLQVDYLARTLRVKQKGGKTWNFTADSADVLLVFQKRVEAARARL